MTSTRTCDLEGRTTEHRLLFTKWGFPIVRCAGCDLISTLAPPDFAGQCPALYDEGYFEGGRRDGYCAYGDSEPIVRRQFAQVLRRIRRLVGGGRLLDLGCAYGFFLKEAACAFACVGMDVSPHGVAVARSQGLDARCGTIEAGGFADGSFDVVTLLDTIEHLPSPRATIREAHRVLAPGGLLAISTGDAGAPYPRCHLRSWRLMTPPQHLYFFSRHTLRRLLESSGFKIRSIVYEWKFVPLGLVGFQLCRRLGLPGGWARGLRGGVYVNLFDAVTVLAVKRGGDSPRGGGSLREHFATPRTGSPGRLGLTDSPVAVA